MREYNIFYLQNITHDLSDIKKKLGSLQNRTKYFRVSKFEQRGKTGRAQLNSANEYESVF